MSRKLTLHEDRLFPPDPSVRAIARELYRSVYQLPIISPHGHTDPLWFADNEPFSNATELLLAPDHYLFRMLYSQGISLEALRCQSSAARGRTRAPTLGRRGACSPAAFSCSTAPRPGWWLNHVFLPEAVWYRRGLATKPTADRYFDQIGAALSSPGFRPRALFDRFNIEALATTESPVDTLEHHRQIRESGWSGRVITTYRPDAVIDPEHECASSGNRPRALRPAHRKRRPQLAGLSASAPQPAR